MLSIIWEQLSQTAWVFFIYFSKTIDAVYMNDLDVYFDNKPKFDKYASLTSISTDFQLHILKHTFCKLILHNFKMLY